MSITLVRGDGGDTRVERIGGTVVSSLVDLTGGR